MKPSEFIERLALDMERLLDVPPLSWQAREWIARGLGHAPRRLGATSQ